MALGIIPPDARRRPDAFPDAPSARYVPDPPAWR